MIDKINDLWFKYNNEVMHKSIFVTNESIFKKLLTEFVENYIDEDNERIINNLENELTDFENDLIDRDDAISYLKDDLFAIENDLKNRNDIISDLKKELAEKDKIINELEYIYLKF